MDSIAFFRSVALPTPLLLRVVYDGFTRKNPAMGRTHMRRLGQCPKGEVLEARQLLAIDPVIAEFQSLNASTLADEDGHYSDWLEIHNADPETIDLSGWSLSIHPAQPNQWQFPAGTELPGRQRIVVFASGKDRSNVVQGPLHTNFELNEQGGYLALVRPDGSVSQSFDAYPAQSADESYGLVQLHTDYELIGPNTDVRAWIPENDALGSQWQQADFDDSAWPSGKTGAGFEDRPEELSIFESFDLPLSDDWVVDLPDDNATTVERRAGHLRIHAPNGESSNRGTVGALVYRNVPDNATSYELTTHISESSGRGLVGIAVVDEEGAPTFQLHYDRGLQFLLVHDGVTLARDTESREESFFLRLARDGQVGTWTASFKAVEADEWTDLATIPDGSENAPSPTARPRVGIFASAGITAMVDNFDINVQQTRYADHLGLDLESAMRGVNSTAYLRIPFDVPVDPAELSELRLQTQFDDGFAAYINGRLLATNLDTVVTVNTPRDLTWNSAATMTNFNLGAGIHTASFNVRPSLFAGHLHSGTNVLAVHGLNISNDDDDFFFSAELQAASVDETRTPFPLERPTPGSSNARPLNPTPIISAEQGLFFGSTTAAMSIPGTPDERAEIRYTIDGTEPTIESNTYSGPLTLTQSTMLRARVFDVSKAGLADFAPSQVAAATFIAVDPALENVSSNLPLLVLDGSEAIADVQSNTLTAANAVMIDTDPANRRARLDAGAAATATDAIEYLGQAGIRADGEDTAGQAKPELVFQSWGKTGTSSADATAIDWLGLASDSDWVLHAPFAFDRAMFRNQLAYQLSTEMGMWAPGYQAIEVYLDGGRRAGDGVIDADDYMGVYVVRERVAIGEGRIDLTPSTPESDFDNAGFIWRVHRRNPRDTDFDAGDANLQWFDPPGPFNRTVALADRATIGQQEATAAYFDAFQETLDAGTPDINDPEGYSKFIDPANWVDHHILSTFMMNVDALRLHGYFTKDAGGRLKVGPVLDFDRSAGSFDVRDVDPLVFRSEMADGGTDYFGGTTQAFWGELFQDPGFWQLYVDRWQMWRQTVLSDHHIAQLIDGFGTELREANARDVARHRFNAPRTSDDYLNHQLDGTYAGEVNTIKQWLRDRGRFMDESFSQRPTVNVAGVTLGEATGADVAAGTQIEILPPSVSFNNDQKLIDGEPGAARGRYLVIGDDSLGEAWASSDFDDRNWNEGPLGIGYEVAGDDYAQLIQTEIPPAERIPGSTTVLMRVDFQVDSAEDVRTRPLILRMKYDDGFVAYLNGQRVMEQSLRDRQLAWNSRASIPPRFRSSTVRGV